MKNQAFKLVLAILLANVMLAGCVKHKQDPNTIRFRYWGDLEEIRILEQLCKDFEAAHPGVHVKPERKESGPAYSDILLQEFAAKRAPDVMFVSPDNLEILTEGAKLADLNPWLEKEKDLKAADYYDILIQRYSVGDKLMALPRDIAPIAVIYYNKDLFDAAHLPYPKDTWHWEDLEAAAIKLTHRDDKGLASQYGFADEWAATDVWALSAGGKIVDDYVHPTRFNVGSGLAAEGALFRWKLLQKDKVMPFSSENRSALAGNLGLFLNGKLAMFHSGIWHTPEFRRISAFHWDVVRFPTKKGAVDPHFLLASAAYAMRSDVANPELCWQLLKFMSGPQGQSRLVETGLVQPALKALANSPVFLDGKDPKNKGMLIYAAEHGYFTPASNIWAEFVRSVWTPVTDPMWINGFKGDPAAVLKEAETKGNQKYFGSK
ncbi:MAG: sugar ABC transporter substrate-binding protein [candidate division FCPU426 bacterium]